MTPRESAYKYVRRVLDDGAYSNLVLGNESGFTRHLVLGCLERKLTLEYFINSFTSKRPDNETNSMLLTGVYQIMYMDVPDSAACDETVELAKKYLGRRRADFVNAILRSVCRNKDKLLTEAENASDDIKYSVSPDICRMIRSYYGADTDRILNSFFGHKKIFLRVNTLKTDAASVAESVGGSALSPKTVLASDNSSVMANINNGSYFIQGLGSQKTVELLDVKPGMTVEDVCACPGGKSFGAAIDLCGNGTVYSSDIHSGKLKLINDGAKRLGITNIITSVRDARVPDAELSGKCDRVICDVPCSALGEMASKPDIRYRSVSELSRLYETQAAILESASTLLKCGGMMTYSTCTLNKRENEENLNMFLNGHKSFRLVSAQTFLPYEQDTSEGFFAALIKKEEI